MLVTLVRTVLKVMLKPHIPRQWGLRWLRRGEQADSDDANNFFKSMAVKRKRHSKWKSIWN